DAPGDHIHHHALDQHEDELVALRGGEGLPGAVEDLEDRDRLRDLLGGELQRAHLPVDGGEAAVDGLELAFDLADAVCEQRPSPAPEGRHQPRGLGA
ncbi:MAG: hypothetical protein ACK559_32805, partial [bacterium]